MHHTRMLRGDRSIAKVQELAKEGYPIYRFYLKGRPCEGWLVDESGGQITVETITGGLKVRATAQPYHFERMN